MNLSKITFLFCFISLITFGQEKPNYWQQHIDYKMNIDVNTKDYSYKGQQQITYTNNAPESLNELYFHLYFNAFQPNSQMDHRLQNINDPDKRMVVNGESKIATLNKKDQGFIHIKTLKVNGQNVRFEEHGTVLKIFLNKSLESKQKCIISMTWDAQVPSQIRRSGKLNKEGIELSMTQWYPKMAEFDFEGWHLDQYIGREFHGVFGDFDVTISIDKKYVIGSSGKLTNPNEVKGYGGKAKYKKGKTTWNFKAKNIHDFAWAADPDFIVKSAKVPNTETMLYFVYQENEKTKEWKNVIPYTIDFFTFMNQKFGTYPWSTYTIVQGGDGGMEYGTSTLITGERSLESLAGVIFHEGAHSWFQHLFATNETIYEFMDEGFTSYAEHLATLHVFNKKSEHINPIIGAYRGYLALAKSEKAEPLMTHADQYHENRTYGLSAYYSGQVLAAQLGYIIGEENLNKTWLKYYNNHKMTHPTPNDFKRVAEEVSRIQLKWYFNQFINTNHTIDYAVKSKSNKTIVLENKSNFAMPLDVFVVYEDGTKELFYIPLLSMYNTKPAENFELYKDAKRTVKSSWGWTQPTYEIQTDKPVKIVVIDPTERLADIDYENNILK